MKRSTLAALTLALLAPALVGCQFLFATDESESPAAARIEMPAGAPVPAAGALELAVLRLHVRTPSHQWVYLHRVTSPWTEAAITWNNFAGAYDPLPIDSLRVDAAGWLELPLTEQVLAWGTGEESFHGLLLRQSGLATPRAVIDSREDAASPPQLMLWMRGPNGLVADSLAAAADVFIWRAQPNANYGDRNPLYAGWAQPQTTVEMQALLAFDLPVFPTTATLGDRVWLDADADGIQDAEEVGLAGITVELLDPLQHLLQSAVSDSSGAYAFADLEPGDYMLRVQAPAGFLPTLAGQGGDPALDSELDPASGFTPAFTLGAGQTDMDRDIGLRPAPVASWTPRSVRFWIRHSGLGPWHGEDLISPLLPLWLGTAGGDQSLEVADVAMAVAVLRQRGWDRCEESPNPITALRAQLLAAKLNVAMGAEAEAISGPLAASDAFLATHAPADWKQLGRAQKRLVLRWILLLRAYNEPRSWHWGGWD